MLPNWIDGAIILFLGIYIFGRRKRGFLLELLDLIGFLLSLILGLKFYYFAAIFLKAQFHFSPGMANALGFLLISIVSEPLFYLVFILLSRFLPEKAIQSNINRNLWFIPSFISGIILIAFLLTTALSLPIRPDIKQTVTRSIVGGYITEQTAGLEKSLSTIFGGAVQDSLNFLTVEPKSEESVSLNFTTTDISTDLESENTMFKLVNKERISRNLKPYTPDIRLQEAARAHCRDMFAKGYFSHYTPDGKSPFDRMATFGIEYLAAGENLAYAPTVEIAHKGLMESPGHRANILSKDFGRIGVGVISAGIYGKMFCQEFTD